MRATVRGQGLLACYHEIRSVVKHRAVEECQLTAPPATIGGDPPLGPLQDNGGPVKTMLPGAGTPAIGKATTCAMTDGRGQPRKTPCTLGAAEAE